MRVEKTPWGDIEIYAKNIRLTIKRGYTPPYLWIEKLKPRKGGYEIILQLDADEELAEALMMTSMKIMDVLKEKGLTQAQKEGMKCPKCGERLIWVLLPEGGGYYKCPKCGTKQI